MIEGLNKAIEILEEEFLYWEKATFSYQAHERMICLTQMVDLLKKEAVNNSFEKIGGQQ